MKLLDLARRGRSYVAASAWLGVNQVITRAQSAVVLVVTARVLTEGEFAALLTVQSIVLLGMTLWEFGTSSLLVREVAVGAVSPDRAAAATFRLRLASLPLYVACLVLLFLSSDSTAHLSVLAIALLSAGNCVAALYSVYSATLVGSGTFRRLARLGAISRGLSSAALVALLVLPLPDDAPLVVAGVLLTGEVLVFVQLRRAFARLPRTGAGADVDGRAIARTSVPYALNSIFNYAYNKGDVLLVAYFAGIGSVAAYGPGSQLQNLLGLAPTLVVGALVATASARPDDAAGVARLRRLVDTLLVTTVSGGILLAGALVLVLPQVLRVLVGPLAADAVRPATILVWSLPFLCVQVVISQALIALGRPSGVTRAFLCGFVVALAMHAYLGPRYGAVGAAVASLARDPVVTVVLLTQYYRMRRRFPVPPGGPPGSPAAGPRTGPRHAAGPGTRPRREPVRTGG